MVPFSRDLMDKQERKVLAAGSHVDRHAAEEMHSLRIECKKLRYAAEFFRPLFLGMDDFISHMKGLQDLLGLMNDVAVMRQLLDDLLKDETDHEILVYAGGLIGWRTCDYQHMLNRFDATGKTSSRPSTPGGRSRPLSRPAADPISQPCAGMRPEELWSKIAL